MKSSVVEKTSPEGETLDRIFHALCDQTRRALLARLAQGPARVTELADPFQMSLAAVGKHLRVLEQAGLVNREVEGRNHHLSFSPAPLQDLAQWLGFYETFWKQSLKKLAHYAEQSEVKPAARKKP
jgi:DNA-binding transcriptional ArsR family regulator